MAISHNYGRGMNKVVIIINAEINDRGQLFAVSPVTQKMVEALKQSITDDSDSIIEVISAATLWSNLPKPSIDDALITYCPLTIQLPEYFNFSARQTYIACKNIGERRLWVEQKLGFKTSVGDSWLGHLWLPIVVTSNRTIYGEIIGEGEIPNSYEQPVELPIRHYKPLYSLAEGLLSSLDAPPAVYLLQFSLYGGEIVFDRLWPFPAAPALITLRTQQPDLFACHWHCLTGRSISNLVSPVKMSIRS
ncbi:hypothetical protein [Myxosarcina sp. GI1]|uniref:hypothetical protein n=1 Tax=Myxosarcina sp. GI1 TaxID=1541065 RepID=UPI00209CF854|nr:hypothetical protein [Myxosarcina sp. GI1]